MSLNNIALKQLKEFFESDEQAQQEMFFSLRESVKEAIEKIQPNTKSEPEMVIVISWKAIENGENESFSFCLNQVNRYIA
ncbi:hypothetical protein C9975_07040 [Thalassospira xiamenensis]|nr:hypothetical protein C9975_07040 [Thalassospira xiamenensis]